MDNRKIEIKPASKEDAVLVADLSRQTFYETFSPDNTPENMHQFLEEQFTRGRLILEVGARNNYFLLATLEGKTVGYIKLRNSDSPLFPGSKNAMEVARLYVISGMIGKGVGKALMQAAINLAVEMHKEFLWLGVWEKNQRAIDFYTRWNFERCGETDFLLGNEVQKDWLMRKKLV